jgi:8-amino-7-oxononanoate synthase
MVSGGGSSGDISHPSGRFALVIPLLMLLIRTVMQSGSKTLEREAWGRDILRAEMDHKLMRKPLELTLQDRLESRRTNGTLRRLTRPQDDRVDFSSNDFLSLSRSPELKGLFLKGLRTSNTPLGSGGSRLLDGNSAYAEKLEQDIAHFHGAEAGLLFNSGFDANAGFFACVPQVGDIIVHDELVHASVHDGMRMSRAERIIAFKHNSIEDLRRVLQELVHRDGKEAKDSRKRNVIVAVESIYSMDGDEAPLAEIANAIEEMIRTENGYIVVDEAHSTGVLGPQGRGLVSELGLEHRIFARLHTFGKALGTNGGMFESITRARVMAHSICQQLYSDLTR